MKINACTLADSEDILNLYETARKLQAKKEMVVWPVFSKSFIQEEIREGRQWKLMIDDVIACNWAITFSDKEIWGEMDCGNAIYIHRIATHAGFRGNRFIDVIVKWARTYASLKGKQFIRLDTLGNNTRLIQHYTSAGFSFLGITRLVDTDNLPEHYHREPNCCRFEMAVGRPPRH
ncbi:MAG TPA: GNAT family N-acetyltransferase [Chitinophagaceae bacterium]|nr:GNAT family N-acetyltransferase [Chitinophagaceae bacterium]